MNSSVFKIIRIAAAIFFLSSVSLLFLDFLGIQHRYLAWTSQIQLVPAILSLNVFFLLVILIMTLLLGRVYCSTICPLGVFQDIVSRITGIFKKDRFSYRPSQDMFVFLRFSILAIFVASLIFGIPVIVVNLEPYSIFGRGVSQISSPRMPVLAVAIISFLTIIIFAIKSGRGFCNTICPVGAFLALISKFAFLKPLAKEKCNGCGLCVGVCKTGCIDVLNKEVDYLRCISCGNCAVKCPKKATGFSIEFPSFVKKSPPKEAPINEEDNAPTDNSRRVFITSLTSIFALGFLTRAFGSENLQFDGGLAENKKAPVRDNPIIPPGAQNIRNFRRRCTACQRCVSLCPNNVLVPSSEISKFMQPHLSFERGFCRPECVRCSRVCPTGAIKPLTQAQKAKTQIGVAVFIKEFCINSIEGGRCARCAHRCPSNAITMVPQSEDSSRIKPEIDKTRCIGCGACEFYCPASPNRAIFVDGVDPHKTLGI